MPGMTSTNVTLWVTGTGWDAVRDVELPGVPHTGDEIQLWVRAEGPNDGVFVVEKVAWTVPTPTSGREPGVTAFLRSMAESADTGEALAREGWTIPKRL